ncbi:MAG: FGGY family carbohydrate kinase, partial [Paracoccaceae bacterium]
TDQTRGITKTGHSVLDYVGGVISPEMETPKLLWLKEKMPSTFDQAGDFFDLTDYLTWRSTGDKSRSVCTLTCKWTYLAQENRWDASYFEEIRLAELTANDLARIGSKVVAVGTALGNGLTEQAAADLGLAKGTPVAAGLIDSTCRRHWHDWCSRWRAFLADGLCVWNIGLHHVVVGKQSFCSRRLGAVFLGHGSGPVVE